MKLRLLNYKQHEGTPEEWCLDGLLLGRVNLMVGKNATGKSRTINVLNALAKMLAGRHKLTYQTGDYDITFMHETTAIRYILHYEDRKVVREAVYWDNVSLLERGNDGSGLIFHEKEDKKIEFQTPVDEIAAAARQDSVQHKFLQPLAEWAQSVRVYKFGEDMGRAQVALLTKTPPPINDGDSDLVIKLFRKADKEFPEVFRQEVLAGMKAIGYSLEDVGVMPPRNIRIQSPVPIEPIFMFVKEAELSAPTEQSEISQGMFRALALIIHLTYALLTRKPSCVLIDDIGEGLDFDRSCSLIDLVIQKVENSEIQLIMTTNDQFVMNRVPLIHWSLLQRNGGKVRVRNYENSREAFEQFRFVGLSNFAFFEMEFADNPPKLTEASDE